MKKILTIVGVLALVAALAVPMAATMVASADEGTTQVTGNVTTQLELKVPSAIALGDMELGWNNGHSDEGGYCSTNNAGGLQLTVASNHAEGKMVSGGNVLSNPLLVNTGNQTACLGTLPPTEPGGEVVTTTPQAVLGDTQPMYSEIQLCVFQNVRIEDPPALNYGITLTYTATTP
jgi:hypothetical protein